MYLSKAPPPLSCYITHLIRLPLTFRCRFLWSCSLKATKSSIYSFYSNNKAEFFLGSNPRMIHNDAAAALLHAQKKLLSYHCQNTVYFTEAKIHDSGHNVPFPIIQTCLEVICVQIFLEHELCPYIYFVFLHSVSCCPLIIHAGARD